MADEKTTRQPYWLRQLLHDHGSYDGTSTMSAVVPQHVFDYIAARFERERRAKEEIGK